MTSRVLIIDNYDSFVYILAQYLGELGLNPIVFRNDKLTTDGVSDLDPDTILISPGPGTPDDSGISMELIEEFKEKIPIFGVCLGLQCIGEFFGGNVIRAPAVMHGKTSLIKHDGKGVFKSLPNPFEATRYHSLIVDRDTLPDDLEVTAETDDGLIMGLRHKTFPVEGVQFHPESILTNVGYSLLENFFSRN
ncbi:MAG: anthranilate/aminodeoxychorismate synthase component II [Acidimicrobiaceae bacterium]|nr:anthranilate/aminodeoxychorismate synthase component II [Acidimicrobiaceae bacterium]OUV78746.1 MAG: anthranilate/aminodeoxychorismate synthase component II [Acidimicrobiaceae bacterium TMED130]